MSKNLHKHSKPPLEASKVKKNIFNKQNNANSEGEARPFQRQYKKNELKLNEFHQKVGNKSKVSIKKKIRDVTRLLAKKEGVSADPDVHELKEKQLKELRKKYRANRKKRFLTQEYEQKYKKIKFFEEQKLKRKLKQVLSKIKKAEEGGEDQEEELDLEELKAEKQRILEDLEYIKYYPADKKYVALFPSKDDEEAQQKREAVRKIIKEIVAKRAVNLQASIERITNSLNQEKNSKLDTFFEVEENPETEAPKKKIVNKKGRIITEQFE